MTDRAVVIGGEGIVGQATRKLFNVQYSFDLKKSNITLNEANRKCLFVFICLPTPVVEGEYKTDEITNIVKQMAGLGKRNIFIIRSTVPPGYARSLHKKFDVPVVSFPEFGNADTMYEDMANPDFVVLGADSDTYWALDRVQKEYYPDLPHEKLIITDNTTAEQIKISLNAFYTTKVIFANEVYDNCEHTLADYKMVKYALEHSRYGSKNHFEIFHKNGRGAGGACLRKDMEFFANFTNSKFFKVVDLINHQLLGSTNKQ